MGRLFRISLYLLGGAVGLAPPVVIPQAVASVQPTLQIANSVSKMQGVSVAAPMANSAAAHQHTSSLGSPNMVPMRSAWKTAEAANAVGKSQIDAEASSPLLLGSTSPAHVWKRLLAAFSLIASVAALVGSRQRRSVVGQYVGTSELSAMELSQGKQAYATAALVGEASEGNLFAGASFSGASRSAAGTLSVAAEAVATAPVDVEKDYEVLASRLKEISTLEGIGGLLGWDEMTMMPPGAAQVRSAQKAALTGVIHAKSTDPEIGNLLGRLQENSALDEYKQATIREAARGYKKSTCVPDELVRREAELGSRAYQAWVQARTEKKWELFAPALKEWVDVRRERAALIDPTAPAYDVLADDYDAGLTAARVTEIFSRVRDGLVPLLKDIRERGKKPDDSWLRGEFDTEKQAALCKEIAVDLGFNLEKGRLDVSVHPFTGGAHPTDVRMTTRFKPDDITEGLTGAIHETGHALYEQGRNLDHDGLPVNMAAGMTVHESQSLLWERMVGKSRRFAEYLLPKLRSSFPEAFSEDRTPEALYEAINTVKEASMIRVEADEVNYPMHVILRFEIEKGLIDGTVEVDDVPTLWAKKMKEYVGVEPADDAQGCLQDLHWSMGAIGYFPTYTLGAMSAVQIFEAAKNDLPDLDDDIAAGRFSPLREWLNNNVHALGSLHPKADDLLKVVTGKALDPDVFLKYLSDKYRDIYRLT